ncbi:MAG: hypothetical protein DME23_24770 [Verrucomicrobia bacterium]|nr:MAG: hypothetical protein DME23_24770 [Verrucomicrobiota bacterium]
MKKLFSLAGWLALLPAAQAHESWAPHTHTFDNQHSDLFILCVVSLGVLSAGLVLFRSLGKRRRAKASRFIGRRS